MSRVKTPVELLDHWAAMRGEAIYLRQPHGGVFHDRSWTQVQREVRQLAGALRELGFAPGERIAVLAANCAEWFVTDLALMHGGYVSVPIFSAANAGTIRYVLEHSEARAVFVGKVDDWKTQQEGIDPSIPRLALPYETMPARHGWDELLRLGRPLGDAAYPELDRVMTIIYTSGSTGDPKGVVHTFSSICSTAEALHRDLGGTPQDRLLSYLPLAHITERVYIEITSLYAGGTVAFVESRETFLDDVRRARPTFFISVPRLWALFRERILERIGQRRLDLLLALPLVRGLVQRRIRAGLGLQDVGILGSGSAPIPPALIEWYLRVGMEITEAWGMTENSAYATVNEPFRADKIGSAGRPGLGCECKASPEGELLFRSPGLMKEYYKDPQATAAAFTEDGFFRTGDACRIDEDGYVYITGRVKDTFKTSKGKFVSPAPIERDLARNLLVDACCVIGRGLPQPSVLVRLTDEARSRPREEVRAALAETLATLNAGLESHTKLDALVVVDEPWTAANGLMTPTLKLRRHAFEERYAAQVEGVRGAQVSWQDELEAGRAARGA